MVGGATVSLFDEWWRRHFSERLGKRSYTFRGALEEARPCPHIVETGVQRSLKSWATDGCSTWIFARFARDFGGLVWGVDHDIDAINSARLVIKDRPAELVHGDSVEFLRGFSDRIDLLYLDSFDYDKKSPAPAHEHTLLEAKAAMAALASDAVVLIDDHDLPGGGRGALAVPYLESEGFELLSDDYQVLLRRGL